MFTTEFIHDVESIAVERFGAETEAEGIKLVIATGDGEKILHLLTNGAVEIKEVE